MLLGVRAWPAIWLAAFAVNVVGLGPLTAAVIASGNTLEVVLGAWVIGRLSGEDVRFGRLRDVVALALAATVTPLVAAAFGTLALSASGNAGESSLSALFAVWWAGDATGVLLVTPLIVAWLRPDSLPAKSGRAIEWASVIAFSVVAAMSAFNRRLLQEDGLFHPLAFVPVTVVVWAAVRLGSRGAATVSLVVATIAVASTTRWSPSLEVARAQVAVLLTFNGILAITGLVLSSVVGAHAAAEAELERGQARYRALIEALPDLIVRASRDGIVLDAHAPADGPLALRGASLPGRRLVDLLPDEVAGAVLSAVAAGTFARVDAAWPSDVRPRAVELRVVPSGVDEVTLICRDVTELKDAESKLMLSDRLASIGMLAAGVAHEINNPLTFVGANLDLVDRLHGDPDPARRTKLVGALAAAKTGVDRIAKIVRDLLRLARAETDEGNVDVHASMELAARMAQREIEPRARFATDYGDLPIVAGSEARLGQVFLNVLVNAAHAIPEGEPDAHEIRVTTRVAGPRVIIEVHDDGRGIPPEVLPRIFEPFFTTKAAGVGTGLGLSICQQIVAGMGGEMSVESPPGAGTTVRIELPIERPARSVLLAKPRIDPVEASQQPGPGEPAAEPLGDERHVLLHARDDARVDRHELASPCLRQHLHLAGPLQVEHREERVGDGRPDREQPMVAQDEPRVFAEIGHEARLLVVAEGDAFVVVVAERGEGDGRLLRDGQEAVLLRRHRDAGRRVDVEDAGDVAARRVDGAVDHEAGRVHRIRARLELLAARVDLHEARRGDLVEQHSVGVDEEAVSFAGEAHGDVREHQIVPAEMGDEAVARGQVHAEIVLGRGHGRHGRTTAPRNARGSTNGLRVPSTQNPRGPAESTHGARLARFSGAVSDTERGARS
jgi:signal transduction histidine kinase